MTGKDLFAKQLCGITPSEVAGLLAMVRRKEHPYDVTVKDTKRVRQWKCDLLGIPMTVREIDLHYVPPNVHRARAAAWGTTVTPSFTWAVEIIVENPEWEFSIYMRDYRSSDENDTRPSGVGKLGNYKMFFYEPWFEGDRDIYRSNMSLIRMIGLNDNDDPDNVVVF